jgi:hypothetical protein
MDGTTDNGDQCYGAASFSCESGSSSSYYISSQLVKNKQKLMFLLKATDLNCYEIEWE